MSIGLFELQAGARLSWERRSSLYVAALLIFGACERSRATTEVVDLSVVLPVNAAYITGTIGSVDRAAGTRLLVERTPGIRETSALVATTPTLPVYWRSGRRASTKDLQVGRVITVWTSGAELRSLPPQVGANSIVIER